MMSPHLRAAAFSFLLCSMASAALAANPPQPGQIVERLQDGHPRLLVREDSFDQLRQRAGEDETLNQWVEELRGRADRLLDEPPSEYEIPDGKRLLSVSRRVMGRVYTLALVQRLTGEEKYRDRAWDELEAAAEFKDWNPSHFLDTAEMTHAFAIGYDWLYHEWSDEQRDILREAIVEHGLEPGMKAYRGEESYGWWTNAHHNWNQVCNGGLTMGALAIGDEEPEIAGRIIHHALQLLPRAMEEYAPDGAYPEGVSYWGYGTAYNIFMIDALESALATDYGLSEAEGFAKTPLFPIHMTGPSGRVFNFADAGSGRAGRPPRTHLVHWFARRYEEHRPLYAWFANTHAGPHPLDVFWYTGPSADLDELNPPLDKHWRGVEAAALRGAWDDPQATWVAFKAGSPYINHAQADLGGFVLEALGQRWFVDLGADNYNMPGYFDRGEQRWTYFRNRAEAHNTLVLNPDDGPDQIIRAETRIDRFESNPDRAFGIMDLTPAYEDDAEKVQRGIALIDRTDVLIQDEVQAADPADLRWALHTRASIDIQDGGRRAVLEQGGEKLEAILLSPEDTEFTERPAEPLPSSPDPSEQASNEDIRVLTIHLPEAEDVRIAVLLRPMDGEGDDAAPPAVEPLGDW